MRKKAKEFNRKMKKRSEGFFADFKKFITKGNVIDLAVAVVISTAFGKITSALVNSVIMPLISIVTGGVNFTDWKWVLKEAVPASEGVKAKAEIAVTYGVLLQAIIDFLIIGFCIFVALRILNGAQKRLRAKELEEEAAAKAEKEAKEKAEKEAAAAVLAAEKKLDEDAKRATIALYELLAKKEQ